MMYETISIAPGVNLRCMQDRRFKQGCLSIQFLRPMGAQEAAANALIPAILLRGSQRYPDLQQITHRLDDLYGASVGTLVRRIGDYQTTGLYCSFLEDRFAFAEDAVLAPLVEFIFQLLRRPLLENGVFCREFVESEKRNLIAVIDSERNDKAAYAAMQLLKLMCREDSFGIPRLGEKEQVAQLDAAGVYEHYQKLLAESPVELFYVGAAAGETVAGLLRPVFSDLQRQVITLPPQTGLRECPGQEKSEYQEVAQAKLSLGFVTPITGRDPRFAAMQVCNAIFGGGMTSKLFMQVREQQSLCYAIGSAYYGSKGILTVRAGIDTAREAQCRQAILAQLEACQAGQITQEELTGAKESILSGLRAVYDSPGAMEGYFSTLAITGENRFPAIYRSQVEAVTVEDVVAAAKTLHLHSTFSLRGADHG